MAKKKTAKTRKTRSNGNMSDELIEKVRVTEEMTKAFMERNMKYKIHRKPEGAKGKKGQLWCCYCNSFKKFKARQMGGYLSYPRCESCGISIEDFWVKKFNELFQIKKG